VASGQVGPLAHPLSFLGRGRARPAWLIGRFGILSGFPLRADLPRLGQASRACAWPTVRRSTIEDVHGIIDQHYEEQRVAAVTRLIEELERIAEERAGHTGLYDKAKSKREKIEQRFQSEILYEAEFLKHTIAELETRQDLRRAVAKKRSDEQFRPFE